ncbi:glycosyltransferase [Marivirga arenosa]|uniref:Glycosyltransferase n=1 Tax=Marivirga arenosa TaxID=3059076 RepID=A0AA51ZUP9_9BACT|nr:glycosyltransferase [Marivirga sp. BKB1-2]WNB16858.1 glycosyltransferase [Marivirga sp. BKB1-2]
MKNHELPVVSVRLMTYDHGPFIKEALDGILMQETNFNVEVVIGDDFSTDNTVNIIREYQDTEKIKIKLLQREHGDDYSVNREKLGRLYNFYDILKNCKGKYIALLDGDDFWTDKYKLQKQFDFLENNDKYIACFHDVKVVNEKSEVVRENKFKKISLHDYKAELLTRGRVLPVLSVMFRNVTDELPEEFIHGGLGDKFLSSFLGNFGDAKYMNNIQPSAYRVGNQGVWSQKDLIHKKKLNLMTVYQLWRYYDRIGKKENAEILFNNLVIQGYRLYPYLPSNSFLVKIEKLIMKINYNFFKSLKFPNRLLLKLKLWKNQ